MCTFHCATHSVTFFSKVVAHDIAMDKGGPLYGGCLLLGGSVIEGSTVHCCLCF